MRIQKRVASGSFSAILPSPIAAAGTHDRPTVLRTTQQFLIDVSRRRAIAGVVTLTIAVAMPSAEA